MDKMTAGVKDIGIDCRLDKKGGEDRRSRVVFGEKDA